MTLPRSVSDALLRHGVAADTIAWTDDLYKHLGPAVVDALSDIIDARGIDASALRPEHLHEIRPMLGARYLQAHHVGWLAGRASPAFWCDRASPGAGRGVVTPLGRLDPPSSPWAARVEAATRAASGPDQPPPRGILLLSQNA